MKLVLYLRFRFRNLRFKCGLGRVRSSQPYLSGDTFRLSCDIDLSSGDNFQKLLNVHDSVFISPGRLSELSNYLDSESLEFPQSNLIIHNGDEIADPILLERLAARFKRIFCVNWLGNNPNVLPIPIGLENVQYLRNGMPRDFDRIRSRELKPPKDRPINLLVAFSLHTNPELRQQALIASKKIPGVRILQNSIYPYEYLELVSQSRFVLSPPGNGPDCHRTWEAIYLGAIPIVLKTAWPFTLFDLPVVQVESWNEIEQEILDYTEQSQIPVQNLFDMFIPKNL